MNGIFSTSPRRYRFASLLTGLLIALVAACSGNGTVPSNPPGVASATSQIANPDTSVPAPVDTMSILKKLTKDEMISSTLDRGNGDTGPYGIGVAKVTYGLKKGEVVDCNFADSTGAAGKGTTIELVSPAPSASPTTFVQSSDIQGCDGVATTNGNDVYAAGRTSGKVVGYKQDGTLIKKYGAPLKAPLSIIEASCTTFGVDPAFCGYTAEYIFASDAITGGIVSWSINNYGNPNELEVAKGFAVNKGSGWGALGPSGLAYYGKTDSLYIADGVDNTVVYFTHASELLVKDEIVVQPGGKTFKCKYHGSRNPCGKLVLAGKPLNAPLAMAVLPNGNLIVANTKDNQVIEMTPKGQVLDHHAVVKSATGAIYGLAAIGTKDSNTALYYTNKNTNTLHLLHQ
jgi:hypothetical protein